MSEVGRADPMAEPTDAYAAPMADATEPVPDDVKAAIADAVDDLVGTLPEQVVEGQREPRLPGGEDEAAGRASDIRYGAG